MKFIFFTILILNLNTMQGQVDGTYRYKDPRKRNDDGWLISSIKIKLKSDSTFKYTNEEEKFKGNWTINSDTLTLKPLNKNIKIKKYLVVNNSLRLLFYNKEGILKTDDLIISKKSW